MPLWAAAAAIGGTLLSIKSLGILLSNVQPEYAFELAPFFFGVATVGVAGTWENLRPDPGWRLRSVAWLAAAAGALAAIAYIAQGDEGIFGVAATAAMLSVVVVLLSTGREIWESRLMGEWSVLPWVVGWLMLGTVPIGGALAALEERLLEVPLLAVGLAWIALGVSNAWPWQGGGGSLLPVESRRVLKSRNESATRENNPFNPSS